MPEGQIAFLNGLFAVAVVVVLLTGGVAPIRSLRLPNPTWRDVAEVLQESQLWSCQIDMPDQCALASDKPARPIATN